MRVAMADVRCGGLELGRALLRESLLARVLIQMLAANGLLALGGSNLYAQTIEARSNVSLPFTREFRLNSAINAQDYRIFVALPPDYSADFGRDSSRYSVLYVLDGNDVWPLAVQAHRLRRAVLQGRGDPQWPDLIIVGIGYDADTYWNTMPFRAGDFTPTPGWQLEEAVLIRPFGSNRVTGGGPLFLRSIREEIIPFVERNFRTNGDRGIIGHSLGAIFVTYVLFQAPETFNRYAILSANFFRENNLLLSLETEFARKHSALSKRVFIARGGIENPGITESMAHMLDSLRARGYEGLDLQHHIFEGDTHFSMLPAAIGRALGALGYDPPSPRRP